MVAVVVGVYLLIVAFVGWLSVHPIRTPAFVSPSQLGMPQEDVEFLTSDGVRIKGWWVEAERPAGLAVFVHGYMMNRAELVPEAFALWQRGISCLLIDTRAQGKSGGKVCTLGNLERLDVRAAVEFARKKCPGVKVAAIGSSMGSAAIALALGEDPSLCDIAVIDSAYTWLPSAIVGWWRFLGGEILKTVLAPTVVVCAPFVRFNPFRVEVSEGLRNVRIPLLFLHGSCDPLALPPGARRNFDAAQGPKQMIWFEGCGHSQSRWEQTAKHSKAVLGFLEEHGFLTSRAEAAVSPK